MVFFNDTLNINDNGVFYIVRHSYIYIAIMYIIIVMSNDSSCITYNHYECVVFLWYT